MDRAPRLRIGRSGQPQRGIGKEAGGGWHRSPVLVAVVFLLVM